MISALYLISEGPDGPIKIGRSKQPYGRLSDLQTGNSRALRLAAAYRMPADDAITAENYLHEELQRYALVGEWFDLSEKFMREYLPDFFLANGFEVVP